MDKKKEKDLFLLLGMEPVLLEIRAVKADEKKRYWDGLMKHLQAVRSGEKQGSRRIARYAGALKY